MSLSEAIKFYNPTDENFVGKWDGETYDIPAKSTKYFATSVAEHFVKHLTNKILLDKFQNLCKEHLTSSKDSLRNCKECKIRSDKLTNLYNLPERAELYKIILPKEVETPKAE